MKTNRKSGFTLIELLVVIAIIGILSSIVLVSLNSARKKGTDTRVISDVQEVRTALESGFTGGYYPDLNGTASTVNTAGATTTTGADVSNINQLYSDAKAQNSNGLIFEISTNSAGYATSYAIFGQLTSNTGQYFCIDSTGATNPAAIAHASSTCPVAGS